MLNVIFFRTETGREPVREWLRGLDKADKQRIGVDIEKVRFRWPVSMPRSEIGNRFMGDSQQPS